MHLGEPKVWYGIPGRFAANFEAVKKKCLADLLTGWPDLNVNLVSYDMIACCEEFFLFVFLEKVLSACIRSGFSYSI